MNPNIWNIRDSNQWNITDSNLSNIKNERDKKGAVRMEARARMRSYLRRMSGEAAAEWIAAERSDGAMSGGASDERGSERRNTHIPRDIIQILIMNPNIWNIRDSNQWNITDSNLSNIKNERDKKGTVRYDRRSSGWVNRGAAQRGSGRMSESRSRAAGERWTGERAMSGGAGGWYVSYSGLKHSCPRDLIN